MADIIRNDCQGEICPNCGGKGYRREDGDNFQICDCVEIWPNETAAHANGFEMGYRAHGEVSAAEISALKEKLNEAEQIIADMMPAALSGLMIDEPNTLAGYNDHRLVRARAFLKENENG